MDRKIPIPPNAYVEGAEYKRFFKRPAEGLSARMENAEARRDKVLNSLYHLAPNEVDQGGSGLSFYSLLDGYHQIPPSLIDDEEPLMPELLVDIVANDSGDAGKSLLPQWFERMASTAQRTPAYAIKKEVGTVQEAPPQEEETLSGDDANINVEALAEDMEKKKKKKKKSERIFGRSSRYGGIVLANGKPIVPYTAETMNSLGNHPASPFSTTITFSAHEFLAGQLRINFNLCYGSTNVQYASAVIPLRDVTNSPSTDVRELEQVAAYLDSLHIEHEVSSGAYTVQIVADPANTQVLFKEQALRDLDALGMPYIQGLRQDISRVFEVKKLRLTFLVPDGWWDFKSWVERLSILCDHARSDCLLPLKKVSGNQPINRKNVTPAGELGEGIPFAPALLSFDDVDQFITIQGDAVARENLHMEWLITFLAKLECQASLVPIGSRKIIIDRDGEKVSKPYIYALTIHNSTFFEMLAQIIPPLGSKVLIEADVTYRGLTRPTDNKTPEQIYMIIAHDIHEQIWNHRRPPTPLDKRQQAWVDDYANLVKPYIHADVWKKDPAVGEATCYMIAHELRRRRGDRKKNEPGESAREHKDRTIRFIQTLPGLLCVPPDNTAEVPQFPGARIAFDFPINTLGDFQFAVKSPRYPNWPRQESIERPVPFLDWKQQPIPQTGSMEAMVSAARSLPDGQLIKCRIVNAYSDHTARSMEQGIYRIKEHQHAPIVHYFTTFEGAPITSDVTVTFSILTRVAWKLFYEPALPFQGYDIDSLEPLYADDMDGLHAHLYPKEMYDDNGEIVEFTTEEFQEREATVTEYLLQVFRSLTPTQLEAVKLLTRAPFANLIIEGVPGSGKTRLAMNIFCGCLHSSLDPKLRPHQDIVEEGDPWTLGDEDDAESDPGTSPEDDIDAGVDFNLRPELVGLLEPEPKKTPEDSTEQPPAPDPAPNQWLNIFQLMPLTHGPDKSQMELIISKSANLSLREIFGLIFEVYSKNCTSWKQRVFEKMSSLDWRKKTMIGKRIDRRHVFHFENWLSRVCEVIDAEDDVNIPPPRSEPSDKAPTVEEAIELQKKRLGLDTEKAPQPKPQQIGLQGMIIANQNVNGDDLAQGIHRYHLENLGFSITVIRVTNLDAEREALIQRFRPERDDYLEDAPSLADILDDANDDRVKDFANNIGDFKKRKYGGVFKLEVIMAAMLRANKKPNLKRELQRLKNPADKLTKEEMRQLKKSIDEFIKEILEYAHVVVCTFVAAQTLHFKKMFRPEVVWIDEASRENECLIRWAQLALAPALLILTGDAEQDKPYCGTINVRPGDDNDMIARQVSIFKDQYMMPFSKRVKEMARRHMAYLTENFRQRGGLHNLSSELFYDGLMQSGLDPNAQDDTTDIFYKYAQDLVRENRIKRPQQKEEAAEYLTYNRLTYVCRSTRTTVGKSSVDVVQARRAVDWAAAIHQAGVPGLDGRRPTICIISPYAAQVEEVRRCMNKVSDQEICKELVEIRTQTNATGGEWDVVINVFVRDDTMGFLADGYRLNVMWTRARFLNLDILNIDFFAKPKGRGAAIMHAYRQETLRNGALLSDKRDWTYVCPRCFETHKKACTQVLKCTFCGGPHHARKCISQDIMAPAISEGKRFVPQHVVEDQRPSGQAITDFIEPESEEREERDQEEAQAQAPDMDSVLAVRNYISELGATPLEFERPAAVQIIQEDNIYDATDNEEEDGQEDDSDDINDTQDVRKVKFKPRKGKAVELDSEEKKDWTQVHIVHRPGWESGDQKPQGTNDSETAAQTENTETAGESSSGNQGWQDNNTSEWGPKPGEAGNDWNDQRDTSNNTW